MQLICRAGHRCAPRPIDLKEGQGLCPVCARRSPRSAEAKFLARVAAFDAQLAPGARYVNAHTPVQLICQQGHQCAPRPVSLKQGQRPCLACNRSDSRKAV
ncbi:MULTISPECIES: hypothetical protein [unclassified Modestobacter]|uniref:hypothetical protein n=1 Tax=unclassified Modestobacter TaxID=2643866 RepID=UPI0022AA7BCD|nr:MULTISPECIES: hypothetical protein [unclassified Modestobacter]MCZ2825991.1 hypothetical protein [Modestobacter sp. VKM Ac-2981]MCZ2852944.1 hypothetical protein [Modestobacter sp. VKM Ac-2982]